ncbi:MAG: hypothetical protein IPL86_15825 [Flavobacteriales bacterium]|nr:hypothetical protein [Flavobacteriales bacterium]
MATTGKIEATLRQVNGTSEQHAFSEYEEIKRNGSMGGGNAGDSWSAAIEACWRCSRIDIRLINAELHLQSRAQRHHRDNSTGRE